MSLQVDRLCTMQKARFKTSWSRPWQRPWPRARTVRVTSSIVDSSSVQLLMSRQNHSKLNIMFSEGDTLKVGSSWEQLLMSSEAHSETSRFR